MEQLERAVLVVEDFSVQCLFWDYLYSDDDAQI